MFTRHMKIYTLVTITDKLITAVSQMLACETEIQMFLYYSTLHMIWKQDFLRRITKAFKFVFPLAKECRDKSQVMGSCWNNCNVLLVWKNYRVVWNSPSMYGESRDELDKRERLRLGRDSLPSQGSFFYILERLCSWSCYTAPQGTWSRVGRRVFIQNLRATVAISGVLPARKGEDALSGS